MNYPIPDRHLDLGCGLKPRNPYSRQQLIGVDVRAEAPVADAGFEKIVTNIAVDALPFADILPAAAAICTSAR